jgi:hypothetical protein
MRTKQKTTIQAPAGKRKAASAARATEHERIANSALQLALKAGINQVEIHGKEAMDKHVWNDHSHEHSLLEVTYGHNGTDKTSIINITKGSLTHRHLIFSALVNESNRLPTDPLSLDEIKVNLHDIENCPLVALETAVKNLRPTEVYHGHLRTESDTALQRLIRQYQI